MVLSVLWVATWLAIGVFVAPQLAPCLGGVAPNTAYQQCVVAWNATHPQLSLGPWPWVLAVAEPVVVLLGWLVRRRA